MQILGDFCNATNIEDPVSIVLSKWNAWVPKIFHKAKLESQNQKKTFKEYTVNWEIFMWKLFMW